MWIVSQSMHSVPVHCNMVIIYCIIHLSSPLWYSIYKSISLYFVWFWFALLCYTRLGRDLFCLSAMWFCTFSLSLALFFVYHSASFDIHILLFMYVIPLFKVQNTHKIRNLFVWKFVLPAHIHKICILYLLFFVFVCALFFTCMCCVCVCVRYIQRISVTFWDVYVWKIAKRMKC